MSAARFALSTLIASAALITAAFGNGRLDLLISDTFFDITRGVFVGNHDRLIDLYLYRGMKILMLAIALFLIGPEPTQTVIAALFQHDGHGQCFPAGHASGGFYLFAWAVAIAGFSSSLARFVAVAGLISGLVMGLTRVAQGAHFLSHVLWSAWVSAALTLLLAKLILKSGEHPATSR